MARLRASWRTSLPVVQQPRNPQSESIARSPYETYGAEHLFTRRAATREVGEKLVDLMRWWEEYTHKHGEEINANPSPGKRRAGSRPSSRSRLAQWPRPTARTWSMW